MFIIQSKFFNNEIYHIVIRGVGDIRIFKNESDYYRAIFSIYEFNDSQPVIIRERRKLRNKIKFDRGKFDRGLTSVNRELGGRKRKLIVEVLAFCLMPNHIHLLLRQIKTNGITRFMRKLGTGYAGYFNRKYGRKGHLFQGKFKAIRIKNNDQLEVVFVYIHTNPISLVEPRWKEKGIKNLKKINEFLESYKWSSYLDYINKKNFPSLTNREFLLEVMDGEVGCKNFIKDWLGYKKEIRDFSEVELD